MSKKVISIIALLFICVSTFAQNPPQKDSKDRGRQHYERIQAEKVAYFTNYLDLSIEESQSFWPIYNAYCKELEQAHNQASAALRICKDPKIAPTKLAEAITDYGDALAKEGNLTNNYIAKFKAILPIEKVAKVFSVENDFRLYLLNKFRQERKQENNLID